MEPFLADLINCSKVPKIIRYIIVMVVVGFIVGLGICCGFSSPMLWGRIFGFALAVVFLVAGIYMIVKIHKN
ncbi:MAG: hypothetical protein UE295_04350 [Acutalibacteraceae bacterium]|nr:hypothetical protein [Acutalibacteraceae bacterium]